MEIVSVKILPVTFQLQNSFRTALGEKNVTHNVWVLLKCSNGIKAYGEASSSLAMPEATQESMLHVLRAASAMLLNKDIRNWEEICMSLQKRFSSQPTAISAMECALLDAYCRFRKISLSSFFGNKSKKIETHFTIPALKLKACRTILEKMVKRGFRKFKVKVTGKNFEEDFKRVSLISEMVAGGEAEEAQHSPPLGLSSFRENSSVIVDANQGWTKESCLKFIERSLSRKIPITLIEQPLPKDDIKGLKFLKNRSPIPIAVDESLKTLRDAHKIVQEDAADIFNIKIAKSGLLESLKIVDYAKKMKKKLMIGCMMESKLGLATSVQWAYGSGDFSYVDLDSFLLLKKVPVKNSFKNEGPFLFPS